jgi:DHA1 family tetracycline resistance protein-like MFS transporter
LILISSSFSFFLVFIIGMATGAERTGMGGGGSTALAGTFIILFFYLVSVGLMVSVYPKLLLSGLGIGRASTVNGLVIFFKSLVEFFSLPIMGSISDYSGRRVVFILCLICAALEYIALSTLYLPIIIGVRIFGGLTNGIVAMAIASFADATNAVDATMMAKNFGLIGAAFGIGFIIGPAAGGILGSLNIRWPCYLASGIMLVSVVYTVFWWRETLLLANRTDAFRWSSASPVPAMRLFMRSRQLLRLVPAYALSQVGSAVVFNWLIYGDYRYGWEIQDVGAFLSFVGVAFALTQGFIIRALVPHIFKEETVVAAGLTMKVIVFAAYGASTESWMAFAVVPFDALTSMADPSLLTLMVNRVSPTQYGALQGSANGLRTLCGAVGSPLLSLIFSYSISSQVQSAFGTTFPGAQFYAAAIIYAMSALTAVWAFSQNCEDDRRQRPNKSDEENEPLSEQQYGSTTTSS